MVRFLKIAAFLPLAILSITQVSISGIDPNFINYQGRLTDPGGVPLDGSYQIAFSIWDDLTSGTQLWAETLTVAVDDGFFNVTLGKIHNIDIDIFGGIDPNILPYLEIELDGQAVTPRTELTASPKSFVSARVEGDILTGIDASTGRGFIQICDTDEYPDSAMLILGAGRILMTHTDGDTAVELSSLSAYVKITDIEGEDGRRREWNVNAREMAFKELGVLLVGFNPESGISFADQVTGDTISRYGPGEIVFNTIGPPATPVATFHPTYGITFADETTGDTTAQYRPDEMVIVQLQPEPPGPSEFTRMKPGEIIFGVDPNIDKRMAEVCNTGLILTDSASGDTISQYGPGEMVMVQLQPEPPGPSEFTRMKPGEIIFGVDPNIDKRMAEVCNAGMVLIDTAAGDTIAQYGRDGVVFNRIGSPEFPMAAFSPNTGILFADESSGDTIARYTPDHVQFSREGMKTELTNLWFEMREVGETESSLVGTSPNEINFKRQFGTYPEITTATYGNQGVTLADTSGRYDVIITANTNEVTHGTAESEAILGGDGVSFYFAPTTGGGTASGLTSESMTFSTKSATSEDTIVTISTEGMVIDTAAGPTKTIGAGQYFKDNSIVAWARVNASATSVSDFGVSSVSKTTTGYYTIVIDAGLSTGSSVIPLVVPEIDSQPTGASSVRLASVNQTSAGNTFEVFINDGYYTPADNDFVFMVTGR